MSDTSQKSPPRLRDRLHALCVEMIDKGILYSEAMNQFERCFIAEYLERRNGNLLRTADGLRMHRNTLAKKIAKYKIRKTRTPTA